jgi:hypothetical protein
VGGGLSIDKLLCRLVKVKLALASPMSFSGISGLDDIEVIEERETSFGGGVGGLSFGLCSGLRGSNWRRICWREASRLWFGGDDLGGRDGGSSSGCWDFSSMLEIESNLSGSRGKVKG